MADDAPTSPGYVAFPHARSYMARSGLCAKHAPTYQQAACPHRDRPIGAHCSRLDATWVDRSASVRSHTFGRMEHRPEKAVARPTQRGEETGGSNRASTVDLLNSPVMILQPESEKDLDTLSRAFEVPPVAFTCSVEKGADGSTRVQPPLAARAAPSVHPHWHTSLDSPRAGVNTLRRKYVGSR